MIKTMTFAELRNNIDPYPADFDDDALKATIAEWFDYRNVCDNEKFVRFFQRILLKDYSRYEQLLRIEAGIAQYDWLVQEYHEHKIDTRRTPQLTVGVQAGDNETTTITPAETTKTNSGDDTTTKTGTVTGNADYTDTLVESTDVLNPYKETTTTTHPTKTIHTGIAENAVHEGTSGGDSVELNRDNPMSSSYVNGVPMYGFSNGASGSPGTAAHQTVATLDWTNPSSQTESGTLNSEKSTDKRDALDNYTDEQTTYTGTDRVEKSMSGERTKARTVNGDTDKKTYNTTDKLTHGHVVKNTTDTAGTNVVAGTHTETTITTGTDSTVVKDRFTGRHDAPADLLAKAARFIENTDAWDWLYKELETCFISLIEL